MERKKIYININKFGENPNNKIITNARDRKPSVIKSKMYACLCAGLFVSYVCF